MRGKAQLQNAMFVRALEKIIVEGYERKKQTQFRAPPVQHKIGLHVYMLLRSEVTKRFSPGFCLRECVLSQTYEPMAVTHDAKTIMIFENGWELHGRWQSLFQAAGVAVDLGQGASLDLEYVDAYSRLRFSPDAIIDIPKFGRYVVEIKGYKAARYKELLAADGPPIDAHRQLQLYLHMLNLDRGIVLVECKDTQEFTVWVAQRDASITEEYLQRLNLVIEATETHATNGTLPTRICSSPSDTRAHSCEQCRACFASAEVRGGLLLPEKERWQHGKKKGEAKTASV